MCWRDAGASGTLTFVDIEAEVRQFEADMSEGRHDADYYIQQMRNSDDPNLRYLLAERLPSLGTPALPPLNRVIVDPSAPRDARTLAAMVALQLGDRGDCIGVLLAEVQTDSAWSIPAANALARGRVAEAASSVAELLERTDPGDSTILLSVSSALKELGGRPSTRARERVARGASAWVRAAFESDFP